MTAQIWSLINFSQKISQFRFILKIFSFSVWVPNFEERKANPRKLYQGVLVRIAKSLYFGGGTSASRQASAYPGLRSASNSASGSESIISHIINLN
jgi:hypothetical protein